MATTQTILITGSNRGLGFSTIQALSSRLPTATYILASRSLSSAQTAISELRKLGIASPLDSVEINVTNDETIIKAKKYVEERYGRLDVLISNAGIALILKQKPEEEGSGELGELRENFNTTFNTNITSIAAVTSTFLPLLHKSSSPKVINISSGRASLGLASKGLLPKSVSVSYGVSKVGINALTVEMLRAEDAILEDRGDSEDERGEGQRRGVGRGKTRFWAVNPGFCKTAFNGFKGTRDPVVGAEVVVRLVLDEEGVYGKGGFWEWDEGEEGRMREVPW